VFDLSHQFAPLRVIQIIGRAMRLPTCKKSIFDAKGVRNVNHREALRTYILSLINWPAWHGNCLHAWSRTLDI
jgi:hypothetical protein